MREVWRSMDGTRATTAIGIGPTTEILKSLICVPDGSRRFLTLRCTPVPTTTAAYTGITPPAQERPQSLSSGPLMEKHMYATSAVTELPKLVPRLSPLTEVPIPSISNPVVLLREQVPTASMTTTSMSTADVWQQRKTANTVLLNTTENATW